MASADLPEEKQKYAKVVQEACDDMLKAASEGTAEGWQDVGTTKGVKVMKKPKGAISAVKGTCVIKASLEILVDWVGDIEKVKKWDDTLNTAALVEEISPGVKVELYTYHGSWPTSARDFCVVNGRKEYDGGVHVIGERSVEHPGAPEVKGNVRGELLNSAFVLKPVEGAENTYEVTYITETDPKGNIPKSFMNKMNESTPLSLAQIRDFAEKAHAGK